MWLILWLIGGDDVFGRDRVHCPRASNGLLPRRSYLVGYVQWDGRSDRSLLSTINSSSFTGRSPVLFSAEILRGPSRMKTGSDYYFD